MRSKKHGTPNVDMIAREAMHTVRTNQGHSKDVSCEIVRCIRIPATWLYLDVVLALWTIESIHKPEAHGDDKSRKAGWHLLKSQDPLWSGTHY